MTRHPIRSALYYLGLRLTNHSRIIEYEKLIRSTSSFSKDEMERFQLGRLNKLLIHAYNTCPYYRKLLDKHKIRPNLKSISELSKIPVLTKKIIQDNRDELLSSEYRIEKLIKNSTGGSTGMPLLFYQDADYYDFSVAYQNHNFRKMGWEVGDKMAYLWGSDKDFNFRKMIDKVNEMVQNRVFLNSFDATEEQMTSFAERLARFRPKVMVAYASSAYLFATVVENSRLPRINPDAIQSSAEALSDEYRRKIESVFNTKVFNSYGSREVGSLAHECSAHQGLHISWQNNIVEVVDGKIIVTNLWNNAMPFIRYEIGDLADKVITAKCSCGNHAPRISKVIGRTTDIIITPNGKRIHGEYFTHLFYGIPGIEKFQVVQEKKDLIVVKIMKAGNLDAGALEGRILAKIAKEVDPGIRTVFEYPKRIDVEKSGKFRFTISHVKEDRR